MYRRKYIVHSHTNSCIFEYSFCVRKNVLQNQSLVIGVVCRVAHNVLNIFDVRGNNFIPDVPVSFLDHIGQKHHLDLVEKEDLAHHFHHLVNRIVRTQSATARNRSQKRHNELYLCLWISVEGLWIFGGHIGQVQLLLGASIHPTSIWAVCHRFAWAGHWCSFNFFPY